MYVSRPLGLLDCRTTSICCADCSIAVAADVIKSLANGQMSWTSCFQVHMLLERLYTYTFCWKFRIKLMASFCPASMLPIRGGGNSGATSVSFVWPLALQSQSVVEDAGRGRVWRCRWWLRRRKGIHGLIKTCQSLTKERKVTHLKRRSCARHGSQTSDLQICNRSLRGL